jgi:hypothetical protein
MITEIIRNKFRYKNETSTFENDSFTREFDKRKYFLGIRFFKRIMFEDVSRENVKENFVGFNKYKK